MSGAVEDRTEILTICPECGADVLNEQFGNGPMEHVDDPSRSSYLIRWTCLRDHTGDYFMPAPNPGA